MSRVVEPPQPLNAHKLINSTKSCHFTFQFGKFPKALQTVTVLFHSFCYENDDV